MSRLTLHTRPLVGVALALLLAACTDALPPNAPTGSPRRNAYASVQHSLLVSGIDPTLCVAVAGGSEYRGAELVTARCDPAARAQRFAWQPSGVITAYDGAICFDARGGPAGPDRPAGYGGDGDVVQIWDCNAWDNQRWNLTERQELVGVNSKCFTIAFEDAVPGRTIVLWPCNGGAAQKWSFRSTTPTQADSIGVAELPRTYLNTAMPAVTGRTIAVPAGGDLQAALDTAQPGDEVVLPAGATYVGNFVLPAKANVADRWITVRTAGSLPAEGTRVSPADAAQMPKILTPNVSPAIITTPGTQGWRFTGLEVAETSDVAETNNYALLAFGNIGADQNTLAQVPSRIVVDRSYVHGSPAQDLRRCIALNSASTAVIDSYVSECHSRNGDSQAVSGWNGPGPFKIVNNRLEGGHENVAFGGADPTISGLIPSDIEIRRNHVIKPLAWKYVWTAKNLVEIKAGQRILLEGNVFENSWADGQVGFAFLWWSANADGNALWSVTQDVTFRYNLARNLERGFNLADHYGGNQYGPMLPKARRVTIAHNVLRGPYEGGPFIVYQVLGDVHGLTIAHNSSLAPANQNGGGEGLSITFSDQTEPLPDFIFRDNITGGTYTFRSAYGFGAASLAGLGIPPGGVTGNVIAAGCSCHVPSGNSFAPSVAAIGFTDYYGGDLRLASASPFLTSGTAGTRPGADVDAVARMTQGVVP